MSRNASVSAKVMAAKFAVRFAVSAVDDLEDIRGWYSEQQLPEVGERLIGEILASVERLVQFPESGRILPELGVHHLREIIVPPFRIVYRLDATKVRVVRVWRSERLLKMP